MKKWSSLLMVAICSLGTLVGGNISHAAETSPAQDIPFTATAKLPENQVNKSVSYFDLNVQPNQEQTVHIDVTNTSNKPITLDTSLFGGKTNINGVIQYDRSNKKELSKAKATSIEDQATINERELHLSPNQSVDLPILVHMSSKKQTGIMIGAVRLLQKNEGSTKGNITNNFAREIGLVLESSDPNKLPSQLEMTKAKASQVNVRNSVIESIKNDQSKLMNLKNVQATVTKYGSDKVLYKQKQNDVSIAPNTTMNYPISLNGQEFKPGKYTATFKGKEGTHTWRLSKTFTVKADESNHLNATDVIIKNKPSFFSQYKLFIFIATALILVIIGLLWYLKNLKSKLIKK